MPLLTPCRLYFNICIKGKMNIKKAVTIFFLPVICTSFLFSQSLVELAKKEKERREKFKGKKTVVITNADLKALRKKPAVSIPPAEPSEEQNVSRPIQTSRSIKVTTAKTPSTSSSKDIDQQSETTSAASIEEQWRHSKELVYLLTLKMNALWQEFYSLDDMTSRNYIQMQISDTYLKLQKAQQEEASLKKQMEMLPTKKRN